MSTYISHIKKQHATSTVCIFMKSMKKFADQ